MTAAPPAAPAPGRPRKRRRPRVLILGLPYFGSMLARLLGERGWEARFAHHPGRDPRGWARLVPAVLRADVIYLISSRLDRFSPQAILIRLRRRPVVIHWVGTDVLIALDEHALGRASKSAARRAVHWVDAPWLAGELDTMGIAAEHVQLPVDGLSQQAPPLPARFTVLLYLPVDAFDREVFDMETLLRLPAAFPDARFILIPSPAATLPGPLPPNLETPGWVTDMDALWRDVTVQVRLTSHDGTSFMVLEALSRGRYSIWTYPIDGGIAARGYDAVHAALVRLEREHAAGRLGLNQPGMAHARAAFDPARAVTALDRALRAVARGEKRKEKSETG